MAQHHKPKNTSSTKKENLKKSKSLSTTSRDLLEIIDNYFNKNLNLFFWTFFAFSVLFTFLLFDLRVSVGGDDSTYIIKADDFVKQFKYPAFQGPLYPILLSPFVAIFGIKLPMLKLLSTFFLTGHLFFFYKSFKNNIPSFILISTISIISINSYLLFYGSQTYSEASFLFAQSLFFLLFFRKFVNFDEQTSLKKQLPAYFLLGFSMLCLGLIKSVGFASVIAVGAYYLTEKKWKQAGLSIGSFAVIYSFWHILKMLVWGDSKAQFSEQASSLMLKHPYDAGQGTESLLGFVQRFFDNSNIYISRQFMKILGLRPEFIQINNNWGAPDTVTLLTILVYALFIIGFVWVFRKNKFLKFTGIYLGTMMGLTFVILQTIWEAHRLIITFFPFMVMFSIAGVYALFKFRKLSFFQFVVPAVAIVLLLATFSRSSSKIKEHQKILNAHLRGNITAGFTPDWVNFINMSIWAAKNVPEGKVIASRKPSISFIYTDRRFFGIYKVETTDPDSLLNYLHENKVEYVVMASLRKLEAQKTDQIINTIQRYLYYIQQKYPEKLKLVHQIGGPDDEPAFLFKIE